MNLILKLFTSVVPNKTINLLKLNVLWFYNPNIDNIQSSILSATSHHISPTERYDELPHTKFYWGVSTGLY